MSFGTLLTYYSVPNLLGHPVQKSEQFFAHFRVWQLAYSGLIDRFCQRASSQTKHESAKHQSCIKLIDYFAFSFITGKRQKEALFCA